MKNHNSQANTTTVTNVFKPVARPAVLGVGLLLTVFAMSISNKAEAADATTAQLQAETNARISADTTEKNARVNAVNTEKDTRIAEDNAETAARTAADNTLTAGLTAEQQARQQGDTDEAAARQQAIQTAIAGLQSQLNALTDLLPPAPPVDTARPKQGLTLKLCPGNDTPQWEHCPLAIGDKGPAGGIVFYVTDGGKHGLEVGPTDLGPTLWGCLGAVITGADSHNVGSGQQNTLDILAGCSEPNNAAQIANDYTLNGYGDWFLPSIDELNLMSINIGPQAAAPLTNAGNFYTGTQYWSSSEYDWIYGWAWDFSGKGYFLYKDIKYLSVRPIRAF
jgi:hypothetical protein